MSSWSRRLMPYCSRLKATQDPSGESRGRWLCRHRFTPPLRLGGGWESEKAEIALLQLAVRGTNVHQAEFAGCAISCCNSRQIEGTQKDLNNNKIWRNKLYILRLILQYSKNTSITHPIFCTIYVKIKFYFVTPGVSNSICAWSRGTFKLHFSLHELEINIFEDLEFHAR